MIRNPHFQNVSENYLFAEIERRLPDRELIHLGIGDTTEPLPLVVAEAMARAARDLASPLGYTGYGPAKGLKTLRESIVKRFYMERSPDEIFISDGAKCEIARLLLLLGPNRKALVQDPAYPVYVDGCQMAGYNVQLLPCTAENGFFPSELPEGDLLFLCSPNNPTGAVATRDELARAVEWAHQHGGLILFDAAYSSFIQDDALPRSIYEIEGADEVAIEIQSFSKLAGFTGVRLGWTVVPKKLPLYRDWVRLQATLFNGAPVISQAGGIAALNEGWEEVQKRIAFYLENAHLLRGALPESYGGKNAPYLWVPCDDSWSAFDRLADEQGVVVTPGVGFGPSGEGFFRISAFGKRSAIAEAAERLSQCGAVAT